MSKKKVILSPLSDLYRTAFDSCAAMWPVFFIRVIFLFLNFTFFFLGLAICCWPFLQMLISHRDDFSSNNYKNLINDINWTSYFGDLKMLLVVGLFAALYITCVIFFLAFFDAAIYSLMNRHQKNGLSFSWKAFFDGGIKKMIPLVGLQCTWILMFLGSVFAFCFIAVLGVFTAKLLPWWISVLLALPAGLAVVIAFVVLVTAGTLSAAYVIDDYGILDSIKEGFVKAVQNRGRAIWACLLVIFIYLIFFSAFSVVFDVFSKFPLIGILFALFKILVTSVLAIGFNIYMTSLSVALQLEPDTSR
jgi:hypothetical protein